MGKNICKIIENIRKKNIPVCMYGLGDIGRKKGQEIINGMGLDVSFYCDKDVEKLYAFNIEGASPISLQQLLDIKEEILVVLTLGEYVIQSALAQFNMNKNITTISIKDLGDDQQYLLDFFSLPFFPTKTSSIKKKYECSETHSNVNSSPKMAVYTCITGGYDDCPRVYQVDSRCDYYIITDNHSLNKDNTQLNVKYTDEIVPRYIKNVKDINRYCKSHGYLFFDEYDYSLYIDGNIDIIGNVFDYVTFLKNFGLAFHKSPIFSDAYCELFRLYVSSRVSYSASREIAKWLHAECYPKDVLCLECGVILCDHHNINAKRLLDEWFELYMNMPVKRDQIYMSFLLWKKGLDESDIGIITGTVDGDDGFIKRRYLHKSNKND